MVDSDRLQDAQKALIPIGYLWLSRSLGFPALSFAPFYTSPGSCDLIIREEFGAYARFVRSPGRRVHLL